MLSSQITLKESKMPQKTNLIMIACADNLTFQIDGTFDKVIFPHESEAALLIEEYLRWVKGIIQIDEIPNNIGTKQEILHKGATTIHESLKTLLTNHYNLSMEFSEDEYNTLY